MNINHKKIEREIFGKNYRLETGNLAKQANGAVLASCEGTTVLATVVATDDKNENEEFLPLTINYQEKSYAAGKIPGGFFKREGRPSEKEVLNSRLIDRPVRPLIDKNFFFPTQIIVTVLSADQENNPDALSLIAASAALQVSDVPFDGPIAAVRVGRINGKLVCNPTLEESENSDIDMIVAGTSEAIVMVEGGSFEVDEENMVDALMFAQDANMEFIRLQNDLTDGIDITKRVTEPPAADSAMEDTVREFVAPKIRESIVAPSKSERNQITKRLLNETLDHFKNDYPEMESQISSIFEDALKEVVREIIVKEKKRPDGRQFRDIREITGEIGLLPRTHGSSLFTRGETQAIVATTLGTAYDAQRIDALEGDSSKTFMLHYNFPPYCVGEVSFRLGPGRREIGHGALAERSIIPVLPDNEKFPYTLRVVSEVLESNGSSSMATVCGSSLSLMDAGVPISSPVGGIAMGLIKEGDDFVILSDILGDEDHLGDMDFKVAGTEKGITALQMDIKIKGITKEILTLALDQAKEARLHVISEMNRIISQPREKISRYAPMIVTMQVKPDKIKDVIGPGGKMIKKIIEETGADINIDDDGKVNIAASDVESCEAAMRLINEITRDIEVGKIYLGKVKRILEFGAIVEMKNGKDGLVHISEMAPYRVKKVTDLLQEGDELLVKCIGKENDGKIRLSRKEALDEDIEDYKTVK